jgi:tetratricopeptide (TPR) repeat protein
MKDLKLSYSDFREKVLHSVVNEMDFDQEAIILQAILPRLKSKEDSVSCLERLCLIYEKKKYDEAQLNKSYEKLYDLDPTNIKALRYFKVVYTQTNQWEKVVQILLNLYHSAKHVNDKYRSAQELAAVYLYQLDQPTNAIDAIEKYCVDSPLNTFTIHYEAYYRIQNWEGCLKVLRNYLKRVEGGLNKAIIHLKIGELEEQVNRISDAEQSFLQAVELAPKMLEPIENLLEMFLDTHNWDKVMTYLQKLYDLVDDPFLKDKIKEGKSRLHDALEISKTKEAL